YFAARLKPIAVRVSRMALDLGRHAYAAGRIGLARHELHELDLRGQLVERYREARRRLLQPQRLLQDVVAAVDADSRPRHVGRPERLETPAVGGDQGLGEPVADVGGGERHRHRTARAPEADAHARSAALESFDRLRRNRSERLAHRWEHVENEVEAADLENF